MKATIAKEFNFEMSHRLPYHTGECRNIHGHSYKLRVEIEGETDARGMLLDYYDLYDIVIPLVKRLDHSFICDVNDSIMLDFLKSFSFKYVMISDFTTAENLAEFIMNEIHPGIVKHPNIERLKVRLYETVDVYAERVMQL